MNIALLHRINHWWTTGAVSTVFLPRSRRSEAAQIIEHLDKRRVLVVTGPRRTGKSTLLFQTIDYLISSGVNPRRILFFSGDERALFASGETLSSLIEGYFADVLAENPAALTKRVYIIVDEAHFCADWQVYVKNYYDARFNIKFIVSGSSAVHLFDGAIESLMGRMEYLRVLPLDFVQYAQFDNVINDEIELPRLEKIDLFSARDSLCKTLKQNYLASVATEQSWLNALRKYFIFGGYPEGFEYPSATQWHRVLREDIVLQGLYRDVVSIYGIKNPLALENIMAYVAGNQGKTHAITSIGQTVGLDFATASNYLKYLESAYLVAELENYSPSIAKTIRKNRKLFVLDNGICNALQNRSDLRAEDEGAAAESCLLQIIRAVAERQMQKCYYWREHGKEVDIVVGSGLKLLPVEVKYRNSVTDSDLDGLRAFTMKFASSGALAVTKNTFDISGEIIKAPLWLIALSI